ncbi:MAG: acyl carrier protein [Acholeplasmatales bacterium]|nr:acyl carrier protein [Acholeplasmatales bacterium]
MQEIFEKIKAIIIDELNCAPEKVTMEAKLKDDLGADSIDAVQIIMDLEDTFGITIEEDNAEAIQTVGNLVEYVQSLVK